MENNIYGFYPAYGKEKIVYGASRPGYSSKNVPLTDTIEWIDFMISKDIKGICVLLTDYELKNYYHYDLLSLYYKRFGKNNVLHSSVNDFNLINKELLYRSVIPFLKIKDMNQEKVVIHCSGGLGRTGHVLAAWLVKGRNFTVEEAIKHVKLNHRNPFEAISAGSATKEELYELLEGK